MVNPVYEKPVWKVLKKHFPGCLNPDIKNATFELIDRLKDVVFKDGVVDFVLVHLGRDVSTDDVLAELDRLGYRPATFWELIAFSLAHPGEQMKYPIVAFGSTAHLHGRRNVAYLGRNDGLRELLLRWVDVGWGGVCRFLAVRK